MDTQRPQSTVDCVRCHILGQTQRAACPDAESISLAFRGGTFHVMEAYMNSLARLCVIAAGAVAVIGASVNPSRAECTTVGSVGTGINEGVAKYMAEAGLKNIIESKGMKPSGAISHKCEAGAVLTDCHAKQRACK